MTNPEPMVALRAPDPVTSSSPSSTNTTIMRCLIVVTAVIALAEAGAAGFSARIPAWPCASGVLTWVGLWVTLVLLRRAEVPASRLISPVVMFAGVYFVTGAVGPALWLLTPLDPPGIIGTSQSALQYVFITFLFFLVAVLVASLSFPRLPGSGAAAPSSTPEDAGLVPGASILTILGLVGLVIRFPSIDSLAGYFSADYSELSRTAEGVVGYVGSVLRPLLPAGIFVWWINGRTRTRAVILFVVTVVTMGSFSLNRGYVIVPLVAFGVAYHARVRRIPTSIVVSVVVTLMMAFILVGSVRTTTLNSQGGKYDVDNPLDAGVATTLAHTIQLYAQPPLQTAIVVDSGPRDVPNALVAFSSVIAPLPGASEELREHTGTRDYNRIIYGMSEPSDQILPSHLEAWWIGGLPGVLAWGVGVGFLLRRLNRSLIAAKGLAPTLVLTIASLWAAQTQIVSVTVLVQAFLYLGPAAFILLPLTRRFTIK